MFDKELNKNIERLNRNIERQTSIKFIILKGIIYGVATVVGASVVAGLLFTLLTKTFNTVDEIPFSEEIVETIEVEEE